MNIYYCWLTVLIPDYQDGIVAGLVRKGYMVGSACKDGKPSLATPDDNPPATLIALSLYSSAGVTLDAQTIYKDVNAILSEMSAKYFSIVIAMASDAAWISSNFSLPVPEKEPPSVRKTDPSMN